MIKPKETIKNVNLDINSTIHLSKSCKYRKNKATRLRVKVIAGRPPAGMNRPGGLLTTDTVKPDKGNAAGLKQFPIDQNAQQRNPHCNL